MKPNLNVMGSLSDKICLNLDTVWFNTCPGFAPGLGRAYEKIGSSSMVENTLGDRGKCLSSSWCKYPAPPRETTFKDVFRFSCATSSRTGRDVVGSASLSFLGFRLMECCHAYGPSDALVMLQKGTAKYHYNKCSCNYIFGKPSSNCRYSKRSLPRIWSVAAK